MENAIIVINEKKRTVSARELYAKLEVNHRFNEWFNSLLKYGFIENVDFTSVQSCTLVNNGAKRELQDYAVTIDMAKEICMLQRSEIGRRFRKYFIEVEKEWRSFKKIRAEAIEQRNSFTETLKEHGYVKQCEYIQTTMQMKEPLGLKGKKKDKMTEKELKLIKASEYLAEAMIDDEQGYHEVNPICVDASRAIAEVASKRITA